jgi:hypothetical protein
MPESPPDNVRIAVLCWIGAVAVWWLHVVNGIAWVSSVAPATVITFEGTGFTVLVSIAVVALALIVRTGQSWARYPLAVIAGTFTVLWLLPALVNVLTAGSGSPSGFVVTMGGLRLALLGLIVAGAGLMFDSRSSWYFAGQLLGVTAHPGPRSYPSPRGLADQWSGSWPDAVAPVGVISPVQPQPVHEQ